jgi:hypothetical protein
LQFFKLSGGLVILHLKSCDLYSSHDLASIYSKEGKRKKTYFFKLWPYLYNTESIMRLISYSNVHIPTVTVLTF